MRPGTPISAAALAALVAVLTPGLFAAFPHRIAVAAELAPDNQVQAIAVAASDFGSRSVALGKGKSVVIDFPRDIKDVLVGNPRIANAVIRSSRRAYVIGNEVGQTNVFFFDADGKQMVGLDIAVTRDLNGIRAAIKQVLPDSDVRVEGIGDTGVILSGLVSSQAEAQTTKHADSSACCRTLISLCSANSSPKMEPGYMAEWICSPSAIIA